MRMLRLLSILLVMTAAVPPGFAAPHAAPGLSVLYNFTGKNGDGSGPIGNPAIGRQGEIYGVTFEGGGNSCPPNSVGCGTVFELIPPAARGASWTEVILYSFTGANGDGSNPVGGVVIGPGGVLYGATQFTGSDCNTACGIVFQLTSPASPGGVWTETVLHSFTGKDGGGDGSLPSGGLVMGANGELYGTTLGGGTGPCPNGCGTVFELIPPAAAGGAWTESVLHSFQGGRHDGAQPQGALMRDAGGILYGTTAAGGAGYGTVFQLSPPGASAEWTETILHVFGRRSRDGLEPQAGLALATDGTLFGTTYASGTDCEPGVCGTVFELTAPGAHGARSERVICESGSNCVDATGGFRAGVAIGRRGVLYAASEMVLFALEPSTKPEGRWKTVQIYNFFAKETYGSLPTGLTAAENSVIYGWTSYGGAGGRGVAFQIKP